MIFQELERELRRLVKEGNGGTEMKNISHRLEELIQKEEEYWKILSRSNWLTQGYQNTKYFHHHANKQKSKNTIKGLMSDT